MNIKRSLFDCLSVQERLVNYTYIFIHATFESFIVSIQIVVFEEKKLYGEKTPYVTDKVKRKTYLPIVLLLYNIEERGKLRIYKTASVFFVHKSLTICYSPRQYQVRTFIKYLCSM